MASVLAGMLPRVTRVVVTTMQCAYWCLPMTTGKFRWRQTAFEKGTCMPITRSYVKEGTYRRGVVQALSTNNPYRAQKNVKQGSVQVKWCFCWAVSVFDLTQVSWQLGGCLLQEPEELWGLLVPSIYFVHSYACNLSIPKGLSNVWKSIYITENAKSRKISTGEWQKCILLADLYSRSLW